MNIPESCSKTLSYDEWYEQYERRRQKHASEYFKQKHMTEIVEAANQYEA